MILRVLVIVLTILTASNLVAADVTPSYEMQVREYIDVTHGVELFRMGVKNELSKRPTAKIDQRLQKVLSLNDKELAIVLSPAYKRAFSPDVMPSLLAFFKSQVGAEAIAAWMRQMNGQPFSLSEKSSAAVEAFLETTAGKVWATPLLSQEISKAVESYIQAQEQLKAVEPNKSLNARRAEEPRAH